jgi:hypothetical protein
MKFAIKTIGFMLIGSAAFASSALSEVGLSKSIFENQQSSVKAEFDSNSELGRAWISISLSDAFGNADAHPNENYRVKVSGLSFDTARGEVVYENNGQRRVCAIQEHRFGARTLKDTGHCKIQVSKTNKSIDDGYVVKNQSVLVVSVE